MNNYSSLIDKYTQKLSEDASSRVFAPLGEIYRKLDMHDKAISVLEDGLKYNPTYNLGIISLAQCLFDIEEYQRAYGLMKPYYKTSTDNIKFLKLYGNICEKLNFIEEAIFTFKAILFLNPRDMEAMEFVENYEDDNLSPIAEREQTAQFNVTDLDDEVESWSQLSLVEQEDVEKPEELPVSHTINISEIDTTPVFSHTLVDLYLKQGAREKAINLLEKALEVNPKDEAVIARLSELRAAGDTGHDNLMAAFDNRAGQIYGKDENYFEKVKMAYDLFFQQIKNKQNAQRYL